MDIQSRCPNKIPKESEVKKMNKPLMRAEMMKYGDSQKDLANALGISLSRLNLKINGGADFRQAEILFIKDRYKLKPEEIDAIFFSERVS